LLSDGYVVIPMNDKGSWAYRVFRSPAGVGSVGPQ
jgi:hypothetical protein